MAEIDTLRGEIDDITIQMIKLLKKRTSVSRQIGTIKGSSGKNVLDEEREEQLRTLVLKACSEIDLDDSMGTRLLNFLLNESVKVQSDSIPQSSHLAIFAKAKEMEKNGTEIIHMEVGEPDFSPPSKIAHMLSEACENGRVKYGTTQGDAEFRGSMILPHRLALVVSAFAIYIANLEHDEQITRTSFGDTFSHHTLKMHALKSFLEIQHLLVLCHILHDRFRTPHLTCAQF